MGALQEARLARTSHQLSWRGRRGAVPSGVFDLRGAESYLTVRRAPRSEKPPLGAVHRWPQQEAGEKCGLVFPKHRRCENDSEGGLKSTLQGRSNLGSDVGWALAHLQLRRW
jgi:hypothetical protein